MNRGSPDLARWDVTNRRGPTLPAEQSRRQPDPESAEGEPGANQPQTQSCPGTVRDAGLRRGVAEVQGEEATKASAVGSFVPGVPPAAQNRAPSKQREELVPAHRWIVPSPDANSLTPWAHSTPHPQRATASETRTLAPQRRNPGSLWKCRTQGPAGDSGGIASRQPPCPGMGPHREWKRWPLGLARDLGHSFASKGYFHQTKLLHSLVGSLGQQCRRKAVDTSLTFFTPDHDVQQPPSELPQPMVALSHWHKSDFFFL